MVENNNRLKELRLKHGYTLDDIESKTGIKRGTYSNYENHNTEPKIETWQKLANFFNVSVPYLQGLEPDFSELTSETKKTIISKLNTFYFDENANKLMPHHSQVAIDDVRNAVNEYVEHAQLTSLINKVASETDKQRNEFLNKYFYFLFEDKKLVRAFNRYIYSGSIKKIYRVTNAQLTNYLAESIRNRTVNEFQTKLGFYISQNISFQLQHTFDAFQRSLNFCKDVEDAKKQFNQFISTLNETEKSLNEANNIDLGNFMNKAKLEQKILIIMIDLMDTDKNYNVGIKKHDGMYGIALSIKEYLTKKNLQVPKEVNEYLENYSPDKK